MIDDWIKGLLGPRCIMQRNASRGQQDLRAVGRSAGDFRRFVSVPSCRKLL
jgi:hypothetical protein